MLLGMLILQVIIGFIVKKINDAYSVTDFDWVPLKDISPSYKLCIPSVNVTCDDYLDSYFGEYSWYSLIKENKYFWYVLGAFLVSGKVESDIVTVEVDKGYSQQLVNLLNALSFDCEIIDYINNRVILRIKDNTFFRTLSLDNFNLLNVLLLFET